MALDSSVTLKLSDKVRITGETYAIAAERLMENLTNGKCAKLTTTKLRRIYGLITNLYTRVDGPEDFASCKGDLQYIKVKMAYESGREQSVKAFIEGTALMVAIDDIATYDQFVLYCRYAESLVAYFKFFGGEE